MNLCLGDKLVNIKQIPIFSSSTGEFITYRKGTLFFVVRVADTFCSIRRRYLHTFDLSLDIINKYFVKKIKDIEFLTAEEMKIL